MRERHLHSSEPLEERRDILSALAAAPARLLGLALCRGRLGIIRLAVIGAAQMATTARVENLPLGALDLLVYIGLFHDNSFVNKRKKAGYNPTLSRV